MGIDYDCSCGYGWKLDYEDIHKYYMDNIYNPETSQDDIEYFIKTDFICFINEFRLITVGGNMYEEDMSSYMYFFTIQEFVSINGYESCSLDVLNSIDLSKWIIKENDLVFVEFSKFLISLVKGQTPIIFGVCRKW